MKNLFVRLLSPCLFGHAPHPLITMRGKRMYEECRRCQVTLREVLPHQRLKVRRPRAHVLTLKRKVG